VTSANIMGFGCRANSDPDENQWAEKFAVSPLLLPTLLRLIMTSNNIVALWGKAAG
jgi:hypothetical protein